ncbi:hypothetical protein FACS1894164_12160 [Spirochaetia bacterium]|nr:hypothetical protein FACS1894164_12160 [Spirochaetia bacterium]
MRRVPVKKEYYKGIPVYWYTMDTGWGVSLGEFILLANRYNETTVKHEYGHTRQSLMLGPLYLLVIGIPSAVFNNLWDRLFHKKWTSADRSRWYYNRLPEKQADRLGGVVR